MPDTPKIYVMKNSISMQVKKPPTGCFYDGAVRDFFLLANQRGQFFKPAKKQKIEGADHVNTLFRLNMLCLNMNDPEMYKLKEELMSVPSEETVRRSGKSSVRNDLTDALRYCVIGIPWQFTAVQEKMDMRGLYQEDLKKIPIKKEMSLQERVQTQPSRVVQEYILQQKLRKNPRALLTPPGELVEKNLATFPEILSEYGLDDNIDEHGINWEGMSREHDDFLVG